MITLVFVIHMDLLPEHDGEEILVDSEPNIALAARQKAVYLPAEQPTDLPIIVWWTPFTPYTRQERTCSRGTCLFTQSRTELNNSKTYISAFMYYGTDFNLNDLPLPRRPHHLWALLHEESPQNNWLLATEKGISLFNITATMSRYSDYPLHLHFLHTIKHLLQPIHTPTHLKSKGGLGLVMYMQSDCNPPSDRDSYVKELMKYISVDSYGKCLHNKDLPEHLRDPLTFGRDDVLDIVGKYKFVLSFENALCHDYFTEKYWRPLYAGSVPIVRGSPTIQDWDPSGSHPSIILADAFESPRALAEYLLKLDSNDTEYNKFLDYKRTGITNSRLLDHLNARNWVVDSNDGEGESFIDGFECFVCNKLHERKGLQDHLAKQESETLHRIIANTSHYHCLSPKPFLPKYQSVDDRSDDDSMMYLQHWSRMEKCALDRARIASEAVSNGSDQKQLDEALLKICHF